MDRAAPTASTAPAADPFDQHAARYAAVWGEDPVARRQRAAVWDLIGRAVPPGARVLDGGCGIGLDLRWLLDQGHRAVGLDASPGMLAEARARAPEAELHRRALDAPGALDDLGLFDAALLDFGVLNCLSLGPAAQALARALRPGAPLVLVPMPRINPSWTLERLIHGHFRQALERLGPEVQVQVEGGAVYTRYYGASEIQRAFSPWFTLRERAALGLLLPPPGTRWPEARLDRLAALEARLGRLPGLRALGDHLLLLFVRGESPPPPPVASPG